MCDNDDISCMPIMYTHAHTSLFLVVSKDNGTLLKLKKKQRKGKKTVL